MRKVRQTVPTQPSLGRRRQARRLSYLEVERKFVPAADFREQIGSLGNSLNCSSNFILRQAERTRRIRDVYYDFHDQLSYNGIWIRHRITSALDSVSSISSSWEAKLRVGGDFIGSELIEIHGKGKIREALLQRLPNIEFRTLDVLADLETVRSEWVFSSVRKCDRRDSDRLSVVLDDVIASTEPTSGGRQAARFRHMIGEVEMTRPLARTQIDSKSPELSHMRSQLEEFLKSHSGLYVDAEPVGKLSAYLAWKRNET